MLYNRKIPLRVASGKPKDESLKRYDKASLVRFKFKNSKGFYPTGEIIVQPLTSATPQTLVRTLRQSLNKTHSEEGIQNTNITIRLDDRDLRETLHYANEINNDPNVEYAYPNFRFKLETFSGNQVDQQWALFGEENLPNAFRKVFGASFMEARDTVFALHRSHKPVIAVIDTGLILHRDFDPGRFIYPTQVLNGSITRGLDGLDVNAGHGTAMSGIISATVEGDEFIQGATTPNVFIMPVKISDRNSETTSHDIALAIEEAISRKVDVINMSIGLSVLTPDVVKAIKEAIENGIIVVAAAGNFENGSKERLTLMFPAALPEVISVGAVDHRKNWMYPGLKKAGSNSKIGFGSRFIPSPHFPEGRVDCLGPGTEILYLHKLTLTASWSGTSFSAAYVSSLAALLKIIKPDLTQNQMKEIILYTSDNDVTVEKSFLKHANNNQALVTGAGRINALRAVNYILDNEFITV